MQSAAGRKQMATKTISIDMEAYRRLKSARLDAESFSKVIKRTIRPRFDVEAYLDGVESTPPGTPAVKAVEDHVASRRTRSRRAR
jgi:predicted CopG family antitoxin